TDHYPRDDEHEVCLQETASDIPQNLNSASYRTGRGCGKNSEQSIGLTQRFHKETAMKGQIYVVLSALSILSVSASGQCTRPEMSPVWDTGKQQFSCVAST